MSFVRLLSLSISIAALYVAHVLLKPPITFIQTYAPLWSKTDVKQTNGQLNLALFGIRGGNADSPNLTDTIIFLSVKIETGKAVVVSIPRDIWLDTLQAKINTAYHYGVEKSGPREGLLLAKTSVSEVVGQPVHYGVVVDFSTFQQVIDRLGGIVINVDRTFDDYKYPIAGKENDLCHGDPEYGCRYEHIHFDAGKQILNGEMALKYVRSRSSPDPQEGSDFARSRRQEKVISAVRDRMVDAATQADFQLFQDLYDIVMNSTVTDVTPDEYGGLARIAWKARTQSLSSTAIIEPDHLYHPPLSNRYAGQWILLPRGNSFKTIHQFISALQAQ